MLPLAGLKLYEEPLAYVNFRYSGIGVHALPVAATLLSNEILPN